MKKFLSVCLFAFSLLVISVHSQAQVTQPSGAMTMTGATLTNADTSYATVNIEGSGDVTITAQFTKTSGTWVLLSQLWASDNGDHWFQLAAVADTTPVAAAIYYDGVSGQAKTWVITGNPHRFYQVRNIQSGTAVTVSSGYYVFRRSNGYR